METWGPQAASQRFSAEAQTWILAPIPAREGQAGLPVPKGVAFSSHEGFENFEAPYRRDCPSLVSFSF